jgi:hypothetical protein
MVRCMHRLGLHCERVLVCVMGWGGCAQGCSGWWGFSRGEPRGGSLCRQSDRRRWGSVAGTESRMDAAADVAGPRWYAACICGQLHCERVLANAGNALMMLRAVGWGGCARG